jgi:hypothetical protein
MKSHYPIYLILVFLLTGTFLLFLENNRLKSRVSSLEAKLLQARADVLTPAGLKSIEDRLSQLHIASPSMADIMFRVQTRFAKLYYAAQEQNWELAQFELKELGKNIDKAVTLRSEVHGVNVAGIADAFKNTQLLN